MLRTTLRLNHESSGIRSPSEIRPSILQAGKYRQPGHHPMRGRLLKHALLRAEG